MTKGDTFSFGVDLVTFCHPGFWNVETMQQVADLAAADGPAFWSRILDAVQASGVTGIELTFPPFDWKGAVAAFGSPEALAGEMARRNLVLCSGFFADPALPSTDLGDPAQIEALIAEAEAYAGFLASGGAGVMVAGTPMLRSPGVAPVKAFDLAEASLIADVMNRLGVAVAAKGVKLALHTEGHSTLARARDIDLLMLLTDPTYVHLCPDTAHLTLMGGDPVQIVERHHERVIIAHWKDALGPMPEDTPIDAEIHDRHRPYFCAFAQGRVDWQGWMRLMRRRQIGGWAIIELDAAPDPVSDVAHALKIIHQALLPAR